MSLRSSKLNWRGFARAVMLEHGAESPLPTRQLKRATAREMGRLLEADAAAKARKDKIIERRKRKSDTAQAGLHTKGP